MTQRFFTDTFRRHSFLLVLLATLSALVAGVWIVSQSAANGWQAAAVERLAITTDALANVVDGRVEDVGRCLQLISHDPDLTSMVPSRHRTLLLHLKKIYSQITYTHTIGPDGMDVARIDKNPLTDYYDRDYFKHVMAGAPLAREVILKARSTGHPGLTMAGPILDSDGKVLGVIVAGTDLMDLSKDVGVARIGRTGYTCVVDEQGRVLAHPDLTAASAARDLNYLPPVKKVLLNRARLSERFQDNRGVWWLACAVPLANGWSAVGLQEEAEAVTAANQMLILAWLATGIAGVLAIGCAWLAAGRIVRPIVRTTVAAHEFAIQV